MQIITCNNAQNFNQLAFLLRLGVFLLIISHAIFHSRAFQLLGKSIHLCILHTG